MDPQKPFCYPTVLNEISNAAIEAAKSEVHHLLADKVTPIGIEAILSKLANRLHQAVGAALDEELRPIIKIG